MALSQFVSASELAGLLGRSFTPEEIVSADIVLAGVTGAIQRRTGQQIVRVEDDIADLQGVWTRELTLPQWPVISVSSVKVNNGPVAAGTWWLAGGKLYRGVLPIFNGPDDWGGDLFLSSWLGPLATVRVVYTHGFAEIPGELKLICMRAAQRMFDSDPSLTKMAIGNYSEESAQLVAAGVVFSDAEKAVLDSFDRYV